MDRTAIDVKDAETQAFLDDVASVVRAAVDQATAPLAERIAKLEQRFDGDDVVDTRAAIRRATGDIRIELVEMQDQIETLTALARSRMS